MLTYYAEEMKSLNNPFINGNMQGVVSLAKPAVRHPSLQVGPCLTCSFLLESMLKSHNSR